MEEANITKQEQAVPVDAETPQVAQLASLATEATIKTQSAHTSFVKNPGEYSSGLLHN